MASLAVLLGWSPLSAQPMAPRFVEPSRPTPLIPLPSESNPLAPAEGASRIGLEVGLNYVMQSGKYATACATFEQGSKLNVSIAAAYDLRIDEFLKVEGLLGFQSKSLREQYDRVETLMLSIPDNPPVGADVEFENVGDARFFYLFVQPSAKYYVTAGLYVGVGVNAGLKTGASTQYTKTILTRTKVLDAIGPAEFYYGEDESSDRYSKVFPVEDRADAAGLVLDGVLYVGGEIHAGRKLMIGPRIQYALPITATIDRPELKLSGLQFSIGARYPFD